MCRFLILTVRTYSDTSTDEVLHQKKQRAQAEQAHRSLDHSGQDHAKRLSSLGVRDSSTGTEETEETA